MFAVHSVPVPDTRSFQPRRQGFDIAPVILAGQRRQASLDLEVSDEAIGPASVIHERASIAL
jgi:hypothetical protein